jgi:DtxR family transcriptional regulator, Mn-dependent transcriptional regulator
MQQYLETLCRLGGETGQVTLAVLAEEMGVSGVSASEMIKKLAALELVTYEPYRGARLTDAGLTEALSLLRRHRLWERFLTDVLDLPWDRVHAEACRLEHATSPLVEQYLATFLDEPDACPHGHPMPTADGHLDFEAGCPMTDLTAGETGVILRVPEGKPELLHYLATLGVQPGVNIRVESAAPFKGPLTTLVGETRQVLGHEVAAGIAVRRQPAPTVGETRVSRKLLSDLDPRTGGVIRRLAGGQAFVSRLAALGFCIGADVTMLQNFGHGPIIVLVRDTRVALGRGEARQVEVEPAAPPADPAEPVEVGHAS